MNRVDAMLFGDGDDAGDVEVGANRFTDSANLIGFIRFETVQREAVFMREDRYGADVQFVSRTKYTNRDFTAIGDQQLLDFFHGQEGKLSEVSRDDLCAGRPRSPESSIRRERLGGGSASGSLSQNRRGRTFRRCCCQIPVRGMMSEPHGTG